MRPTAMLFRNLASMDVEESIRANPIDGVVLMCGCDKTTPSLVMGAASCDIPSLVVSGGPMLNGKYQGRDIGSGTDLWRFSEEVKAGTMSLNQFMDAEACMSRSPGHCMTMGTASTMAAMVEALGLSMPGNAAIPAVDSRRSVLAHLAGRRIVDMVREDLRISRTERPGDSAHAHGLLRHRSHRLHVLRRQQPEPAPARDRHPGLRIPPDRRPDRRRLRRGPLRPGDRDLLLRLRLR